MAGLLSPHLHRHVSLSQPHQTPRIFSVEPLFCNGSLTCPSASKASTPIAIACISTLPRRRSNASKQRFTVTATARSRHVSSVSHGLACADGWRRDSSIDPRRQTGRVRASRGDSSSSRDGWQGRNEPHRESRFGSRQARTDGRFGGSGGGGWREDERDPRQERDYNEGFDTSGRGRRVEWDHGERGIGGGRERGRGDWREGEGDGERNWRREGSGRWDAGEEGEREGGGRESRARDGYGRFEQDRRGEDPRGEAEQWQERQWDGRGREERSGRSWDTDQRGSFSRDGGSRYSDRGRGRGSGEVPRGARRDYNEGSTSGFRNRGGLRGRRDDAGRGDGSRFREGFKQGSREGEQWESEGRREYDPRGSKREDQAGEDWEGPESGRRESLPGRRVAAVAAGGRFEMRGEERGGARRAGEREGVREGVRGGVREGVRSGVEGKEEEAAWQDPLLHVGEVASVSNAFVKRAVRLRQSSAARRAWGRVLVAGEVPVQEICAPWLQPQGEGDLAALGRGECPLDILLVQSESPSPPPPGLVRVARRVLYVSPAVMSRLAGVQSVGAAAVAAVMLLPASFRVLESGGDDGGGEGAEEDEEAGEEEKGDWDGEGVEGEGRLGEKGGSGGGAEGGRAEGGHGAGRQWFEGEGGARGWGGDMSRVLVLDGVQDPGNLGTLLRTALAFDWVIEKWCGGEWKSGETRRSSMGYLHGVFLLPGCCDPFNDKALRASRGVLFRRPVAVGDWSHLLSLTSHHNLSLLAAHPAAADTADASAGASAPHGICLVLGSEGQGLSATALRLCQPVAIPMPGGAESLNVAVAGGILLFLLGPHSPLPPSHMAADSPPLAVSV
ncbi:unnamed protein product [Closterium sp. Naga37s-1]|nr:unnamed protein product [Closterium sp. Naga37s-1]